MKKKKKKNLPGILEEATSPIDFGEPPKNMPRTEVQPMIPALPFLSRFSRSKKEESEKEILDTFRKVQVNILLLNSIKQMPRYAKFLKELCTNKCKVRDDEKVRMGKNVSTVLQQKLPQKCKDLGTFTIPCTIGKT